MAPVGGGEVIGWALTDTNDAAEGAAPLGANCNPTLLVQHCKATLVVLVLHFINQ